jgi:hypothetical protein
MAAWRTSRGGRPAARAMASCTSPSERALTHLAQHERGQEAALVLARALEQARAGSGPPLGGARPALAGQRVEGCGPRPGGRAARPAAAVALEGRVDRCSSRADAALGKRAREVHGEQLRLASARLPQHVRDERDLLVLLRGRAHPLHERGQGERGSRTVGATCRSRLGDQLVRLRVTVSLPGHVALVAAHADVALAGVRR